MKISQGDRFWSSKRGFGTVVKFVTNEAWYVTFDSNPKEVFFTSTHPSRVTWTWVADNEEVELGNGRRALEEI